MDFAAWPPWVWGAGAAACWLLLTLMNPWRAQFREARRAWMRQPSLCGLPVLAALAEMVWSGGDTRVAVMTETANLRHAALATGDSLAMVMTWPVAGECLSIVLAAGFFANGAGLRHGLYEGIGTSFPHRWQRTLRLAVVASATAALGIPAVRFGAGGASGLLAIRLMAALWHSLAAAMVLAWLVSSFEKYHATSTSANARQGTAVSTRAVRLWPWVIAGMALYPLVGSPLTFPAAWRPAIWPGAVLVAWLPLALLHTEEIEWPGPLITALHRLVSNFASLILWLMIAGSSFFLLHAGAGWLSAQLPPEAAWARVTAGATQAAETWLVVWMLGAWVGIQLTRRGASVSRAGATRRGPKHE